MKLLINMLSELFALFVDDGSLVLAVIGWVIAGVTCLRAQWLSPASTSVLLAVGVCVLLTENVLRFARALSSSQARPIRPRC